MESLSLLEAQESATDGREGVLCEWQFKILETAFLVWKSSFAPGAVEFYFIYFKAILGILKLRKRQITSMTNQSDLAGATVCTAQNTHVLRKIRLGFALCRSRMVDLLSRRNLALGAE